jgi:hypothetical protein
MNAVCKWTTILLLSVLGPSGLYAQPPAETGRGRTRDNAVVWKPSASWQAARKAGSQVVGPRLAILASGEKQREQALTVQALLEAEAFRNWHGELLERAQLDLVLGEQRLSALLSDANAIKLGQLVQADYFLVVSLEAERVRCRVNHFPSTTVVVEFDLAPSAEDRLAKRIALRAFRAMAERSREPNRLAVAIGSFLVDDPFSQFTNLDSTLHTALRDRLSKVARIDLAERFQPTHLLREFELGRGGLVPSVMAQLTAPASDVLIVGDVAPTIRQNLDNKDVAVAFHVRVVSPTGLFEPVEVKFIQPKADSSRAADQITEAVKRALADVPQTPKRQVNSDALAAEFQTLKQRIFRMLPSPPQKSGNFFERGGYRGPWQFGKPMEIERTLRALENALLLKGDDAQLLVCAVSLVYEMARERPNDQFEQPSGRQKAMLERSCDYIETALAVEFNYNTRGMAYTATNQPGYWKATPERIRAIAERIVRDGVPGGWFPHEVEYSRLKLMNEAPNLKSKIDLFRLANRDAGTKADERLRLLQVLDRHYLLQRNAKTDAAQLRSTFEQLRGLADELRNESSACSRGMGCFLKASTSFHSEPPDPRRKSELLEAIDSIPAMAHELGAEFPKCNYSEMVHHLVRWASEQDKSPASMELTRRYIARQVEIDNFRNGLVADSLLRLLPTLDGDKSRAEALQWLTRLLEQYTHGGSADFERMKLARWRNHLQQSASGAKMLGMENLVAISLDSETQDAKAKLRPYDARIKKVVSAFGQVWALRCDYSLQDRFGEVFVLAPTEIGAARVKGLSPKVTDIVAGREQLAVASIDSGLALVNPAGKVVREFRPGDSPLPTPMIRTLATDGTRFFLGLPGRNDQTGYGVYFQYELDPQANTLKKTEDKLPYHSYYQMRYDKSANRIVAQTWDNRCYEANGARWTFVRTPVRDAVHRVTVADAANKPIFTNIGFDLNYVYDFTVWQDRLVFATGNGLYVARPGSDKLTCVMNELDLEFFSLCPVGDKLFVGTNRGLYRIDAKVLAQLPFQEGARKK